MATTKSKIDSATLAAAADLLAVRMAQDNRPKHTHTCPKGHRWVCPSPYCEDVAARPRVCPGCGGELPRDTTEYDFGGE